MADVFAPVFNVINVNDSWGLTSALASYTKPTIIRLAPGADYRLDRVYPVNANLCIEVSGWCCRIGTINRNQPWSYCL